MPRCHTWSARRGRSRAPWLSGKTRHGAGGDRGGALPPSAAGAGPPWTTWMPCWLIWRPPPLTFPSAQYCSRTLGQPTLTGWGRMGRLRPGPLLHPTTLSSRPCPWTLCLSLPRLAGAIKSISTDEIMSQFPSNKTPDGEKRKEKPEDAGEGGSPSQSAGSTPPPVKPSATSATLELDKLMASLSDFRVQSNLPGVSAAPPPAPARVSLVQQPVMSSVCPSPSGPPPPGAPAPQGGNLDSMLVMLQSDLSRQGISTSTKGLCASCQKPIAGQVVTALGNTWHPEHFVCTHCQKEMGGSNFFEKDGAPYCERDYFQLFSPRCGLCNEPILDKMVTALDKNWHPEHFCCVKCGRPFGEEGFHEKDGQQYCRQDFYELFSTRCQGCGQAILENYISALSALWHPECFVCRECYAPFLQGSFFEHDGRPFCETHYHKQRGSLCWGCEKPIAGRCITAMARKFHPEHFVCAFCLKQLNKGTFKEQNDKPYCHPCFLKLFG
ncbi:transforming growth factor beta-1-induced transcript 1 protein isoform X3 [Chelonia mydas]|uniref:transforming growth factor beta-1-induced transcript 1 protein isoform X3 n=2 Tax=Chelonia mydas TaxID=8469 RepID=UPI001CA82635|nr:transforming growth factor beta-1-induced transcript 1 protein isoform X3 [Chelonia mydas]